MRQFDRQIRDSFLDNLNSVHASEDLIQATLRNMNLEDSATPKTGEDSGHFSAINTRYVRNHLKNEEKKLKKQRLIHKSLIAGTCVAAALLIVSSSLFAIHSNQRKNAAAKEIPFVAYVTFSESYYFHKSAYHRIAYAYMNSNINYSVSADEYRLDDATIRKDNDSLNNRRPGKPCNNFDF